MDDRIEVLPKIEEGSIGVEVLVVVVISGCGDCGRDEVLDGCWSVTVGGFVGWRHRRVHRTTVLLGQREGEADVEGADGGEAVVRKAG